jgi:glycosyltransferase involved in cell wall biosynthesis/GT2 family glycosyltransferase
LSRLLFVSYSGVLGGAERVLLDFASGLPGESLIACPDGPLAGAARAAGVPVFLLPERSLALRAGARGRLTAAAALAGHSRDLRRLRDSLDPDLTVAWGMRSAIAGLGGSRRRPMAFAHNDFTPGPLIAVAVRAAARRAARVIVPSDAVARELDPRGRLGERLHVVNPGVVPESFAASDEPASPPEVLVLGALTEWKRPDLALEAVALARRGVPELRLRLVGAGVEGETGLTERLRARAAQPDLAGAVELAGFDPDPRAALARATCLLHCAPREPFGLAVLESLAAGRPAVVPASCGPAEIVDDSCGVLYEPGDAGAAAAALVELVSDPARAAAMGRRGRERARRFDRTVARARFRSVIGPAARPKLPQETALTPLPASSLAIVTVTHDSAADLQALLTSVDRHLAGARVVVVDSGSADASAQVAREHPGVTLLELGENVGFGRACNRGLAVVAEPVVALLNPDVELIDDSLLALAAEAARADRGERLLAPRVLNDDGSIQDTVHPRPGSAPDLIRALVPPTAVPARAGVALAPWRAGRPRRVGWAVGCALVAQTRTLTGLGPFDESLFMYGEDLELGLHAHEQDVETWLWPAVRVVHHRAHSTERAFGGEAFGRLARSRHQAVARRRGPGWAVIDDSAQMLTFASRIALKRALGRSAVRERRQLAAVRSLRRGTE